MPTAAKKKAAKDAAADLKGELTTTAKPKKASPEAGAAETSTAKAPRTRKTREPKAAAVEVEKPKKTHHYPGPVVRLIFPIGLYSEKKDAIKAALKEHDLKFQYMGAGQGRYFDDKVTIFAKWGDVNADYTLRGDAGVVEALSTAWKALGATDFTEEGKAQEEAAEVKAWKLEEPQRRPGEPDFFFRKRVGEWDARDPRKAG